MSGVPHANRQSNDGPLKDQQDLPEQPLTEEELKNQEEEDDQDLKELKQKLQRLSEQKPPENKDELIQHLMDRLQHAETAIGASEEVITRERQNRKVISKELKAKNQELRELVNAEKKKLRDKVHEELEKTLNQALKEKMKAESKYKEAVVIMTERDSLVEELDDMFIGQRDEFKAAQKLTTDQQKIIEHLEEELQQTKEERDSLQHLSDERQTTIQRLNTDLDEAYNLVSKLEEARIVLNRLLGPTGVITERERQKFLKNVQGAEGVDVRGDSGGKAAHMRIDSGAAQGVGQKMLNANNQYFYEGGNKRAGAPGGYRQGPTGLTDDANEDDFWYQAPKVAGEVIGGGEYQGFVNNQSLNSQGGSRRKQF